MKKYLCLLLAASFGFCEPLIFNSILTPANCTHKIYHPRDKNIPHPFFQDQKMDRAEMNSPVKAVGSGTFIYYKETHTLEYAIAYSNLSSPAVMIHLQIGYPHQDGPIIATIMGQPFSKSNSYAHSKKAKEQSKTPMGPLKNFGFITGSIKLTELDNSPSSKAPSKEEKLLVQGGCYITIHTHLNELGEIRGQLTPLSTKQLRK